MLGTTLIWYQVVEVRQPGEKRLLASLRVVKAFHREQFPLDGLMCLIQQGAGGSVAKFDFWAKSKNWMSGIQ
jgi:hypothetical protein